MNEQKSIQSIEPNEMAPLELQLAPVDIEVSTDNAFKLPFDQIPAIGTAFASLPEQFRTITSTTSELTRFIPVTESGELIKDSELHTFKNLFGQTGGYHDVQGKLHQAHWIKSPQSAQSSTVIPYNPTMIFMAVALSQINQKLDAIQETQEEMFEYLKQKDKAALRGNIQTLNNVLQNYKHNWDNDLYIKNTHMKVLDAIQETDKQIVHLRAQIEAKTQSKKLIKSRLTVSHQISELIDLLKEYQLANYAYSFASFLEPMLSKNFKKDYLDLIEKRLSEYSIRYRELYSKAYSVIENSLDASVDKALLGGVSFASKKLGNALAKTPLGKASQIDEALLQASDTVEDFNEDQSLNMAKKLQAAKDPNVILFQETIAALNILHNKPVQLAVDKDNLYVIPQFDTVPQIA